MIHFKVSIIFASMILFLLCVSEGLHADSFPLSEKCKKCHERVYDEWISSSMSQSLSSPLFKILLAEYLSKDGPKDRGYCIKCHAPQSKVNPEIIEDLIQQVAKGKIISDGVGCSQCHLIKGIDLVKQDIKVRYELGRTLFGPYSDPIENMAHNSQFMNIYQKSEICLSCHQFKMVFSNGEVCCDAFDGWKKSVAAKEGKECQSCHMKERHGPSADEEKPRKIAGHDFPGRHGKLVTEAVKIDMEKVLVGDQLKITVSLQSLVPHNFPGGHPPFAQVILNFTVKNQDYKTIYSATQSYRRIFEDGNGNRDLSDFNGIRIAEDSIFKVEELKKEQFTIQIPKDTKSVEVEATLNYSSIADEFQGIRDLIPKDSKGKRYLEPQLMAKKTEAIRFHK
ncbi:MAG TPA: multiheme c-type cytochrome [Nitrospiria bacterium]|nr:multiheme c-type cytochrome [Nitrospiria bacterium]